MGAAGSRLARFAKAFDMKVLATKRDPSTAEGPADEVGTPDRLAEMVPEADFIALTCPLTPETTNIIDASVLKAMKPTSYLINVARGQCVDEPELLKTLESGGIAGAGLDHFVEDPLGPDSPFWKLRNVIITPHGSGESRHSEDRVLDILDENLSRLWNGQTGLKNQIV
jgi:D-2-hydroxyacid dehydrogenase (NADP+)